MYIITVTAVNAGGSLGPPVVKQIVLDDLFGQDAERLGLIVKSMAGQAPDGCQSRAVLSATREPLCEEGSQ